MVSAGEVALTAEFELEDGQYVARCVELGTASCGDTVEEAVENIAEAIAVHLNALEKLGQLEEVLRAAGVVVATPERTVATQGLGYRNEIRKMESAVHISVYA